MPWRIRKMSIYIKKSEKENIRIKIRELCLSVCLKRKTYHVKYSQNEREQVDMIANCFGIAQSIRLLRENRGLTIEKLAELAGVSANHMSKVENGLRNLSMESYLNVLQALGVYPIFIARTDDDEATEKYILDFIDIIKGCSRGEVDFLLNMAESMKENMIRSGLIAIRKK